MWNSPPLKRITVLRDPKVRSSDFVVRLSSSVDKEALRAKLLAARTVPAADLKRLTIPALFISGMEDVIFPPPAAAALAKLVPAAKLESVPEAGHSVYFQRPEAFNRLVSNFFETHQSLAAGSTS